ncbi:MAG: phosphoribosylaminoimidazolesuccinocarboxamide synthase [Nitrosopumilaceae archaeon]|nr:phosphoribosylaminoimidazolesuccinocarboxamide synthase [Nitrosopumilaceae archaeon]
MKFLASGKVKDIYDLEDGNLLFQFSNRVSAYDVKFKEEIPQKGKVLCKFAEYWFNKLPVSNHFVKRKSDNEIIVKKMNMLPIECVVRGYFYGSLVSRWKKNEVQLPEGTKTTLAAKLPHPIFDPTTKAEHDIPIDKKKAIEMKLVTEEQYAWLEEKSLDIYNTMAKVADDAGFILADLKLEFGILDGKITLGDSIGPDECRLWPKSAYIIGKTQEAYDKQILRDWLSEHGYQQKFEDQRASGKEPTPPDIPIEIIEKMTQRYVTVFEKITGHEI